MNDVTGILNAIRAGDAHAGDELMSAVYAELRRIAGAKMAREQPGHTLQPTALVHEAWMRLGDQTFENRAHFFSAAAEAMRRILVDRARRAACDKHGAARNMSITRTSKSPRRSRTATNRWRCMRRSTGWRRTTRAWRNS